MFINSVSNNQNYGTFKSKVNPEIVKNKYKILLTQDIWSPKLKVKMPDTPEEKEVLTEILKYRMKLDRYTRLTNERAYIIMQYDDVVELKKKKPNSEELKQAIEKLNSKGNICSIFNTINKAIKQERLKNRDAIEYFDNITKIEEEYLDKKIIRLSQLEKFWHQIRKNNINKDDKLSTKELLNIINGETKTNEAAPPVHHYSKKEVIFKIKKDYETSLRRNIDIYDENRANASINAKKAEDDAEKENEKLLSIYPEIRKMLPDIYKSIKKIYNHNVKQLLAQDMYSIGEVWVLMKKIEKMAQESIKKLNNYNEMLKNNPNDNELSKKIKYESGKITSLKNEWLDGLSIAVKHEKENQKIAESRGLGKYYDYLIGINENVVGQKFLFDDLKTKYGDIKQTPWTEVFKLFI